MYLPSDRATPQRPRHFRRLESCRYVGALLVATADQWQATWHRRARKIGRNVDIHLLVEWFDDERRSWERVRLVTRDYRHSATRLALIRATRECADRYSFDPLEVGFPRYGDAPLEESVAGGGCDGACEAALSHSEECMRRLSATLHESSPDDAGATVLEQIARSQLALRRLDAAARPASTPALLRLCTYHAALWQRLGQWLEAGESERDRAESEFRALVKNATADGLHELGARDGRPLRAVVL
jgi:hypothetical protein